MALQMFLDERKTVIALKSSSSLSSLRPLPPPFAYALAMRALTGVHQYKEAVALWMEVESQGSSSCLQPFVISSGENIFGNKIRNL